MASLIILKGKNATLDLTRCVPMGKWNVNNIVNYEEWEDSNYVIHRREKCNRAQGSFTLRFPNIQKYQEFVNFLATHKNSTTGAIDCEVWCTNEFRVKSITAFLEFEPSNDLPLLADNKSEGFTVELQERG